MLLGAPLRGTEAGSPLECGAERERAGVADLFGDLGQRFPGCEQIGGCIQSGPGQVSDRGLTDDRSEPRSEVGPADQGLTGQTGHGPSRTRVAQTRDPGYPVARAYRPGQTRGMTASPYPMRTERLTLRFVRPGDEETITAYRNDPEVARLQDWDLPYTAERARDLIVRHEGVVDLQAGRGHQIAVEHDGALVGDLYVGLHEQGGIADLGFTLIPSVQGKGLAFEAASAVVEDAVERLGVHRVVAELSTENLASARLLERLGMTFESHTRRSFWWRGRWDDNLYYSMTGDQWRAWRDRPRGAPADLRLVPITDDNFRTYGRLAVHRTQERFVASVWNSYVDAMFHGDRHGVPLTAVLRGIEADGEPVGFLMWSEATAEPYFWRFLLDRRHQGRGIGRRAFDLWAEEMRSHGHTGAETSWVRAPGGPEAFHESCGWVRTGEYEDGEALAHLDLNAERAPNAG